MIEKRIPSNKDTLIRTAELSFLNQATTLGSANTSGTGGSTNKKSKDSNSGGDDKDY